MFVLEKQVTEKLGFSYQIVEKSNKLDFLYRIGLSNRRLKAAAGKILTLSTRTTPS